MGLKGMAGPPRDSSADSEGPPSALTVCERQWGRAPESSTGGGQPAEPACHPRGPAMLVPTLWRNGPVFCHTRGSIWHRSVAQWRFSDTRSQMEPKPGRYGRDGEKGGVPDLWG